MLNVNPPGFVFAHLGGPLKIRDTWEPPKKEMKSTDFKNCPRGAAGSFLHEASKKTEVEKHPKSNTRNEWGEWEQM